MRIFKTKAFNKWAIGLLTDASLLEAAYEIAGGTLMLRWVRNYISSA